jgi:glycosyltransferase involved in cell wall biosynthesis
MSKIKILTISDHPLSPSGVGTQTRYVLEALLKTGNYSVVSLAGAMKHDDYKPQKTEQWGDDWVIYPVDGYGNPDIIRSILRSHRPDMLWFMTDPRFYGWLWEIEDEVRCKIPMVYYHVWDNKPYPTFNKLFYDSCDVIATISKVTDDIVANVSPDVERYYAPHAVNPEIFKPVSIEEKIALREKTNIDADKFVFFWNNRNARRKQSGSLIFWFKTFLDKVGHDKAMLLMHTDTRDPAGQDLVAIVDSLEMTDGQVQFSEAKIPPDQLAMMYHISDCTINVADAEGFGLSTLESLSSEVPIIATMTGGLQEQVTDGENWFGIGLEPTSKAIIGSQQIPWIYEDRLNEEVVVAALLEMYNKTEEERRSLGALGREHVIKNYNFESFQTNWVDLVNKIHQEHGSWDTRKKYKTWELLEIA